MGGVAQNVMLNASNEGYIIDNYKFQNKPTCPTLSLISLCGNMPRPLLIGATFTLVDNAILITGGGGVCFSFGTFWNKGCFTFRVEDERPQKYTEKANYTQEIKGTATWRYLETVEAAPLKTLLRSLPVAAKSVDGGAPEVIPILRLQVDTSEDFSRILRAAQPVIMENLNIGSCTLKWTTDYLKDRVGRDREVTVSFIS